MASRDEAIEQEHQRLSRSSEFWYMVAREMMATVVRTAGVDAARELSEGVEVYARQDFTSRSTVDGAVESVAARMLEELRRLSRMWEESETIEHYGDKSSDG